MNATHEYPTELLDAEREAGLLLCRCSNPVHEHLTLWDAYQCARCGRKVPS
jgi:hypothetical protein